MSTLQIGRYRGGNAAVTPGTASFDEVANVAGLSDPALPQQLRRVRTNGILYRTINTGASWLQVSLRTEVVDNAALAALTEMREGQLVQVTATDWLWKFTAANGWQAIDTRDAGVAAAPAAVAPITGWPDPTVPGFSVDRNLELGSVQDIIRVLGSLILDLKTAGIIAT